MFHYISFLKRYLHVRMYFSTLKKKKLLIEKIGIHVNSFLFWMFWTWFWRVIQVQCLVTLCSPCNLISWRIFLWGKQMKSIDSVSSQSWFVHFVYHSFPTKREKISCYNLHSAWVSGFQNVCSFYKWNSVVGDQRKVPKSLKTERAFLLILFDQAFV